MKKTIRISNSNMHFMLSRAFLFVLMLLLFVCFFNPLSIVITSLGEERAGLYTSRAIVCLYCTC